MTSSRTYTSLCRAAVQKRRELGMLLGRENEAAIEKKQQLYLVSIPTLQFMIHLARGSESFTDIPVDEHGVELTSKKTLVPALLLISGFHTDAAGARKADMSARRSKNMRDRVLPVRQTHAKGRASRSRKSTASARASAAKRRNDAESSPSLAPPKRTKPAAHSNSLPHEVVSQSSSHGTPTGGRRPLHPARADGAPHRPAVSSSDAAHQAASPVARGAHQPSSSADGHQQSAVPAAAGAPRDLPPNADGPHQSEGSAARAPRDMPADEDDGPHPPSGHEHPPVVGGPEAAESLDTILRQYFHHPLYFKLLDRPHIREHASPKVNLYRKWDPNRVFQELEERKAPENRTESANAIFYRYSPFLNMEVVLKRLRPGSREVLSYLVVQEKLPGEVALKAPIHILQSVDEDAEPDERVVEWLMLPRHSPVPGQDGDAVDLYKDVCHRRRTRSPVYDGALVCDRFLGPLCKSVESLHAKKFGWTDFKLENFLVCMQEGSEFSMIDPQLRFPNEKDCMWDAYSTLCQDPLAARGTNISLDRLHCYGVASCGLHLWRGYLVYDTHKRDCDVFDEIRSDRARAFDAVPRVFNELSAGSEYNALLAACLCNAILNPSLYFDKFHQYITYLANPKGLHAFDSGSIKEDLLMQKEEMQRLYQGVVQGEKINKVITEYEEKQTPRKFDVVFAELMCSCHASGSAAPTLEKVGATVEILKDLHLADVQRARAQATEEADLRRSAEAQAVAYQRNLALANKKIDKLEQFLLANGLSLDAAYGSAEANSAPVRPPSSVSSSSSSASSSSSTSSASSSISGSGFSASVSSSSCGLSSASACSNTSSALHSAAPMPKTSSSKKPVMPTSSTSRRLPGVMMPKTSSSRKRLPGVMMPKQPPRGALPLTPSTTPHSHPGDTPMSSAVAIASEVGGEVSKSSQRPKKSKKTPKRVLPAAAAAANVARGEQQQKASSSGYNAKVKRRKIPGMRGPVASAKRVWENPTSKIKHPVPTRTPSRAPIPSPTDMYIASALNSSGWTSAEMKSAPKAPASAITERTVIDISDDDADLESDDASRSRSSSLESEVAPPSRSRSSSYASHGGASRSRSSSLSSSADPHGARRDSAAGGE